MVISWQVGPARQAGEVKGVKPHRRLAAGEAERGGGARESPSGDQTRGRDHERGARARPHLLEQAEEAGWPELAGVELEVAAGVRPGAHTALRCTTGAAE